MIWLAVLIVIVVAVALVPVLQERGRQQITPNLRKQADGQFAKLSAGQTRYQWHGGTRGPVIVLGHGVTTPAIVWSAITPALAGLGFRVLCYDLYGRGFSDAPKGAQDMAFFTRQLDDLLADQGVSQDITLMGYSMGASIVTAYAAAKPHTVARAILVAPAGIKMNETVFETFCRTVPILGDWAHGMFGAGRSGAGKPAEIAKMQAFQLSRRGYLPSVLASRRGALNGRLEVAHRKLGRENVPVWAFWGRDDTTIPLSAMGTLIRWNRAVHNDDIAGAGHGLPYTHAHELATAITAMMRDKD